MSPAAADVELLDAWCAGDRHAGDALVRRYFDPVRRFFRSKLGDEVEDLIQGTFLDCVERRADIRDDDGFRGYLFAIARNRLNEHLRARYRAPEKVDLSTLSVADLATSPSQLVARSQEERLLVAALRLIPIDHQIAIELAYWEELSGREMAIALGIAENTVRSRLARARDALREALERVADAPARVITTLSAVDARLEAMASSSS
jgi:RNA polymerase sigma factor (sigma-70 family)